MKNKENIKKNWEKPEVKSLSVKNDTKAKNSTLTEGPGSGDGNKKIAS